MEVLQVSKFYYPEYGGLESVVRTVAEGIVKNGHESRVLATVPRGRGAHQTVNGVSVTKATSFGQLLSVPIAPTVPYHLRQAVESADLIHYHIPNPVAVASHFTAQPSVPTVATYHSDIVRQSGALRVYEPFLQHFLRSIDRIIVTSPRLLEHSNMLTPHVEKCTLVPLSVDLDAFGPPESSAATPAESIGGPVLLFVGKLRYYKGVKYLLKAMQRVEATLAIIGDGKRRQTLEDLANDYGVDNKTRFIGHVSDEELHAWYDDADLFILPSVEPSEAFGVVQLEAMAYGTPVINTRLPTGVPWVSVDGQTGLTVPPRDSDALAEAIQTILADDDRRAAYGQAARNRVKTLFSQDERIEQILDLYQNVRKNK